MIEETPLLYQEYLDEHVVHEYQEEEEEYATSPLCSNPNLEYIIPPLPHGISCVSWLVGRERLSSLSPQRRNGEREEEAFSTPNSSPLGSRIELEDISFFGYRLVQYCLWVGVWMPMYWDTPCWSSLAGTSKSAL
jgi:hypothetical protein